MSVGAVCGATLGGVVACDVGLPNDVTTWVSLDRERALWMDADDEHEGPPWWLGRNVLVSVTLYPTSLHVPFLI